MAVEFFSYGYDTVPGAGLGELTWQEMFPVIGLASYGVRSPADWKVTAVSGADRTVSIAAGRGYGYGVIDKTVANDTIQLDTVASGSRWDLIACRRDPTPTAGVSQFIKINGGTNPVIPGARLSGPGIHDQPLYLVQVTAGQTQPTGFIDLRTWAGDGGGLTANHELVLSFLNQAGTRIHINGTDWVRKVGANDILEWESSDTGQAAADVTTAGSGWQLGTGGHKPRLRRNGPMVHMIGAMIRTGSGSVANILTIPASFRPAAGQTLFIGSGVTDNGIAYELALLNGVVSIIGGYATRTDTDQPTTYPVTASWPIT